MKFKVKSVDLSCIIQKVDNTVINNTILKKLL